VYYLLAKVGAGGGHAIYIDEYEAHIYPKEQEEI